MISINVQPNGSQLLQYSYDGYRVFICRGQLSCFLNYSVQSHWHDDLEFISVLSGAMDYNVNGKIIHLEKGQGIIVNSKQVHFGFSSEHNECNHLCILIHPSLLSTSPLIERDFVTPILSDSSIPYIFLDRNVDWQRSILNDIEAAYILKDRSVAPLYIQNAIYHIWITLTENTLKLEHTAKPDRSLSVLKEMLTYIQLHYTEKITIDDIASSGNVSKSSCLLIFKKYLQDTPVNYLIGFRLKSAVSLLKNSNYSITEIASAVGFQGVSYFTETFRKTYGCTPSEMRASTREAPQK